MEIVETAIPEVLRLVPRGFPHGFVTLNEGLATTIDRYLQSQPWWRALQDRDGVGQRLRTG